MENRTASTVKKAASAATQITFSFIVIAIAVAFLGGTVMGKAARHMYTTMFSQDTITLPNAHE